MGLLVAADAHARLQSTQSIALIDPEGYDAIFFAGLLLPRPARTIDHAPSLQQQAWCLPICRRPWNHVGWRSQLGGAPSLG